MMDLSPIFSTVFTALQWLVPLLWLAMLVQSAMFKGWLGRGLLLLAVKLQLDDSRYHLIRNLMLPAGNGSARIDHIIVSRHGLFVVTISSMQGRIYGDREQQQWSHRIGMVKQPFPNPLQQSNQHARALAAALGLPTNRIFPLVVFVGDIRFKSPRPANVLHGSGYIRYIESKDDELFSQTEVERLVEKLELLRLISSRESFIEQAWPGRQPASKPVATKPVASKRIPAKPIPKSAGKQCPRCGGTMVLHASKKLDEAGTQFWGCASFPECKGVLEVTSVPLRTVGDTGRFSSSVILPSGA